MRSLALVSLVPVFVLFGACSDDKASGTPAPAADSGVEPQSPEDVKPAPLEGTVDDCPAGFKDAAPKAGWNRGFEVSGQKRDFWVIYPEGEPSGPQPVFVAFNGTSENGQEFAERARLEEAHLLHSDLHLLRQGGHWDGFVRLLDATRRTRGFGDYYGYGLVAAGKAEVYLEVDLKPWDAAPMKILVEEAGGRLTDFAGRPSIYDGSVLATNGRLHDQVLAALRG